MEIIDKSCIGRKKLWTSGVRESEDGVSSSAVLPPANPQEVLHLKRKLDTSNSLEEVKTTGHALATAAVAAMAASAIAQETVGQISSAPKKRKNDRRHIRKAKLISQSNLDKARKELSRICLA